MLLVSTTRIIPGRAVPSFLSGRYPAVKVRKKLYVTRDYIVNIDKVVNRKIAVSWEIAGNEKWITVDQPEPDSDINVTINVNHKFFKPYSNEEEFQVVLEKFVIAFVIAEAQARINSDKDGYIFYNVIRNNMNGYLSKLSEG